LVLLCRPRHWAKNVFVLVPLVFSETFYSAATVGASLAALACFCLWSSSVYALNDVLDARGDRRHPRKCRRPVAAGQVSPPAALLFAAVLALGGGALAFAALPRLFLLIGGLYLANSVTYCLLLKHRVIADVLAIAAGFVLRLLGGCYAIGVE